MKSNPNSLLRMALLLALGPSRISHDLLRDWSKRKRKQQLHVGCDCLQDYRAGHALFITFPFC